MLKPDRELAQMGPKLIGVWPEISAITGFVSHLRQVVLGPIQLPESMSQVAGPPSIDRINLTTRSLRLIDCVPGMRRPGPGALGVNARGDHKNLARV